MKLFAFFFLLSLVIAQAAEAPQSMRENINQMEPAEVEKAIQALRDNFLSAEALDDTAKQRALLEGLIRRLSPGVAIVQSGAATPAQDEVAFLAEILDGIAGYVRVGTLTPASLQQLDVAVASFNEKKVSALILDLRGVPAGGSFEVAADFARRFSPKGKILFTIQKPSAKQERLVTSNQDPSFTGIVVVLTDSETSGSSEALAATLRANAKAMIVGSDTAGEAVEFAEIPIGSGRNLRVAVSQVVLPDSGSIFPHGVKPDIAISLPKETQDEIFRLSKEKGVSQFIFDVERVRLNEAALVANTNPEIEGVPSARSHAPLRDSVLQRAVDLVTAITFYKRK